MKKLLYLKGREMRLIIAIFILVIISGCAYIPKPKPVSSNGMFPANKTIKSEDVLVNKRISKDKKYKFVYLKETIKYSLVQEVRDGYSNVHRKALLDMGYENVYDTTQIQALFAKTGVKSPTYYPTEESLIKLQNKIGSILIVEINYEAENSEWDRYTIKASEPGGVLLFHVSHVPFVWSSFESEMIYPAFNELIKWSG